MEYHTLISNQVHCLDDGMKFDSMAQAASHYNISASYFSTIHKRTNLLKTKGVVTCKGIRFKISKRKESPILECTTDKKKFNSYTKAAAYVDMSYAHFRRYKFWMGRDTAVIKGKVFKKLY